MDRQLVTSSNIVSIGYDESSETLEVEFRQERIYQYFGVPLHVYNELMAAPSHGKFHGRYIKDSYPFDRIA